jgi:hypothetical protein
MDHHRYAVRVGREELRETEEQAVTELPAYDVNHPSVGGVAAWLSTEVRKTAQGDALILTIRIPNTTVTVMLAKGDAENWDRQIHDAVSQMSSLVIAPAGPVNGHRLPGL